jgi:hypothetical protein
MKYLSRKMMRINKIWFDGEWLYPEINVGRFAEKAGINAGLLRNYINGFKKPSKEREQQVLQQIHQLGQEFVAVEF